MTKQSIFLKPAEVLTKLAGIEMGDDSLKWEQEIIGHLHEAHPYLQSDTIQVKFNKRNEPEKTATGDIFIDNKIDIPFVIDKGELQPLDMFMHGGDLLPMNRRTVMQALQDTNFGTSIPAGSGETADVFNTNAIPPFDGKYTFASLLTYGQLKEAEAIVLQKGRKYHMDPETGESELEEIIKNHMDELSDPELQTMRRYDLQKESTALPVAKAIYDDVVEDLEPGSYTIKTAFGSSVSGIVFAKAYDPFTGYESDSPIFHEAEGKGHAISSKAVKTANKSPALKKAEPSEGMIGSFCWAEGTTYPVKIAQVLSDGFVIQSLESEIQFIVRPTVNLKTASRSVDTFYIPEKYIFHPCVNAEIDLSAPDVKVAHITLTHNNGRYIATGDSSFSREPISGPRMRRELCQHFEPESVGEVLKVATHRGFMRIKAPVKLTEKTASVDADFIKSAGVSFPDLDVALDAIPFIRRADIEPFRGLTPAQLKSAPDVFAKVAIELSEEMKADTVDGILGAHFLTEETVSKFMDQIDLFRKARRAALELLLAARLGLEIPQGPIRAAAFALDDVVNSLHQLRRLMVASEV